MKTFIKVTEIWIPTKGRTQLELATGIYGTLKDFKQASEQMRFDYDQGLPGTAWAVAHPVVITEFTHSCFRRAEAAEKAGLTCAIALPVFSGEFLMAVVVFLCGDDEDHAGAILGESESFIRGRDAKNAGITTALGIPLSDSAGQVYLMTFLSAKATPIARQLEIWLPDDKRERLVFKEGFSEKAADLAAVYAAKTFAKGEGVIERVWLTGIPVIVDNYGAEESIATLLMPVINQGKLTAVVVFCL